MQAKRRVRMARLQNRISARLTAGFGYNQTAPLFDEAYRSPLQQQRFGLQVDMPLVRWGAGRDEVGAALRLSDGEEPGYQDNLNYLTFTRVLAYYNQENWGHDFTPADVLQRMQRYAAVLQANDELLSSDSWFDRERLLTNERALYTIPWDWEPLPWIDEAIAGLPRAIGPSDFVIRKNSNEIPRYEFSTDRIELFSAERDTSIILVGGYGPDREFGFSASIEQGSGPKTEVYSGYYLEEAIEAIVENLP